MTTASEVTGAALHHRVSGPGENLHGHRALRWVAIVLAVVVGLALLIRAVVDPIATHYTRKGLKEADAIRADFQRVHVTILPPGYEIRRLKIREASGGTRREPLFYVETARVSMDWRELFHARLAAALTLDRPKVVVVQRGSGKAADSAASKSSDSSDKQAAAKTTSPGLSDLESSLRQVLPSASTGSTSSTGRCCCATPPSRPRPRSG